MGRGVEGAKRETLGPSVGLEDDFGGERCERGEAEGVVNATTVERKSID